MARHDFCFSQVANFSQLCASESCAVSSEHQLVVHQVPSQSAVRSEQKLRAARVEQDAQSPLWVTIKTLVLLVARILALSLRHVAERRTRR